MTCPEGHVVVVTASTYGALVVLRDGSVALGQLIRAERVLVLRGGLHGARDHPGAGGPKVWEQGDRPGGCCPNLAPQGRVLRVSIHETHPSRRETGKSGYNGFIVPPSHQFEAMSAYLSSVVDELRNMEDGNDDFGRDQRTIILGAKGGHIASRMEAMDDDALMEFKQAIFELHQLCEAE